MGRKLFVGGLAWATDEDGLRAAFEDYGDVTYVKVVTDRETGRSRGFGFVEFATEDEASAAMAMDGKAIDGRSVRVNEANERPRRDGGGGGPRRHGGGPDADRRGSAPPPRPAPEVYSRGRDNSDLPSIDDGGWGTPKRSRSTKKGRHTEDRRRDKWND